MASDIERGGEVLMRHLADNGFTSPWLKTLLALWITIFAVTATAGQDNAGGEFVAVAFHEVVSSEADLDEDAVTTDRLIQFFEFLLADGWTVLSLDDVDQARLGQKRLPPKSILITFDDGYVDLYTHVFPLLQAYNFPVVSALVGQWMDAPMTAQVNYGGQMVPRTNFLSWEQAREMQASGLVEFASHSYDQHLALQADVHGTQVPAMVTYAFEAQATRYQNPEAFDARIRQDLLANHRLFRRELGKAPRAFVWPYGRYSLKTIEIARSLGYSFALNLNDEPARASWPMEIARYLPERNPTLGAMLEDLRHQPGFVSARRLMTFDMGSIWDTEPDRFDRRLGTFIEDVRQMAPTDVAFKPYRLEPGGTFKSWFYEPSRAQSPHSPATRVAWQLQSRADVGVMVQVSLPELSQALGSDQAVLNWFAELGRRVPVSGLLFEHADAWWGQLQPPDLVPPQAVAGPWDVRQQRRALDASRLTDQARLALLAFRAVEQYRPTVDWAVMVADREVSADPATVPPDVPAVVDLLLLQSPGGQPDGVKALPDWVKQTTPEVLIQQRRLGLWLGELNASTATQLGKVGGDFVANGGAVLGWHLANDAQTDAAIDQSRAALSASTFPVRF